MKFSAVFILFVLLAQLSGCASYYASRPNYNDIISQWIELNEYTKIEHSLKKLSKNHPNYKRILARKKFISSSKKAFIESALASAKNQQARGQWQAALNTYNNALAKAEGSTNILTAKKELLKERDMQIAELRKNMLLRRAKALIQYKPIYKKLKKLIPNDYEAQYDINKFEDERNETSAHLESCGRHALSEKNYSLAEECLKLSNQLITSEKTLQLINKIKIIIRRNSNKEKVQQLIKAYNEAYDSGNFPKARLHLDQLLIINPNNVKSRKLKKQLDRDINTRIEKGINHGKTQYSEGKINAALKTWQDLSQLDPKNEELGALISRAKKVSLKIEKLEKSSSK